MTVPDLCILYGPLRSGTTMLRLMLNHHPRIRCPGEADFLADHLVAAADTPSGVRYDPEALENSRIFRAAGIGLPERRDGYEAFVELTGRMRTSEADCLALDMHRGVARILDFVPGIPVIHLLRDPRDVARSAIGMGWAGNVYHGADIWLESEQEFERAAPRFAPGQVHEIRYEDLVRTPEATLTALCAFLGLDYDPAMLSYDETSTYSAPDPSLAEQWRRKQSPRELGLVEPRFGDLMAKRGYAPSGHPAIAPGAMERLSLWLGNKRGIWRKRFRRYGPVDPVLLRVADRLGLKSLARRAQRRIDAKTITLLK